MKKNKYERYQDYLFEKNVVGEITDKETEKEFENGMKYDEKEIKKYLLSLCRDILGKRYIEDIDEEDYFTYYEYYDNFYKQKRKIYLYQIKEKLGWKEVDYQSLNDILKYLKDNNLLKIDKEQESIVFKKEIEKLKKEIEMNKEQFKKLGIPVSIEDIFGSNK